MHAINQSTANDLHHQVINAISAILYTRRRRIWWMTGSAHWYAILLSCSASRLPEYWNRKPGVRVLGRFRRNVHRITWTMHESLQAVVAETDNDANRSDDFSRARRAFVVRNVGSVGRRRVREHNEGLPCRDVHVQHSNHCWMRESTPTPGQRRKRRSEHYVHSLLLQASAISQFTKTSQTYQPY